MNKTLRDLSLGAITVAGLWGTTAINPTLQLAYGGRSPQWPKVQAEYLKNHGECAACGQKDQLQVHHIVPFHVDRSKELDPANLITLCVDGPGNCNCHLLFGHLGNFQSQGNPTVHKDAKYFRTMLKSVKFK